MLSSVCFKANSMRRPTENALTFPTTGKTTVPNQIYYNYFQNFGQDGTKRKHCPCKSTVADCVVS
eukprot:700829-Amphidinium_carterae.1